MNENPFFALVNFAKCDQQIIALNALAHKTSAKIHSLKLEYEQQKTIAHAEKLAHIAARKQVDEIELEIRTVREQEKRARTNLENASSVREYHSLEAEIKILDIERARLEDALFDSWQIAETADQKEQKTFTTLADFTLKHTHETDELRTQSVTIVNNIAQLDKEITRLWPLIPTEWQEKYTAMKQRVNDPVVPVINNACSSCFHSLLPQELTAMRLHKLIACQDCFRLLYNI